MYIQKKEGTMEKIRTWVMPFLLMGVCIYLSGCSLAKVDSRITPNTDLNRYETYYVVWHAKDERHIDEIIRDEMQVLGINAQSGPPDQQPVEIDVVVTYEDRWMWDMSNYLMTLTLDFHDSKSNVLLATGQSYRPSLERKPPDFMAREILEAIFKQE
jgi:hypothetical protein